MLLRCQCFLSGVTRQCYKNAVRSDKTVVSVAALSLQKPVRPGDVIYRYAPRMPSASPRPCVVVSRNGRLARLVPCSSKNWSPFANPWVHLKDAEISFLTLDQDFTVDARAFERAGFRVSKRIFEVCIAAVRNQARSGCKVLIPVKSCLLG